MLHKFKLNELGDDYVVGDLHGCYSLLLDELSKINFDYSVDRLFAVGDLIDRGSDSWKCLNLMYEPWFFSVRGNHEDMMFDVIAQNNTDGGSWFLNGGTWFMNHMDDKDSEAIVCDLDERMPYGIEIETKDGGKVGIVHADVYRNEWEDNFIGMNYATNQYLVWSRDRIEGKKMNDVKGINKLYAGHSYTKEVSSINNVTYIDTGAVFCGKLSVVMI